jgi:hypothetical protein
MSSAIEDEEADLRDGLRGLPLARTTLVDDEVRWMGGLADEVAVVGEVGEVVGKGTEVGRDGGTPRGVGGGEGSCWSWSSSLGMWKRDFLDDAFGRGGRGAKAPGPRSLVKVKGEREAT